MGKCVLQINSITRFGDLTVDDTYDEALRLVGLQDGDASIQYGYREGDKNESS